MSSARMDFDRNPEAPRSGGAGDRYSGSNLFIAARPDAAAARAAQALARDVRDLYRIGRQPLPDWRLHVSLIGLGRHPVLPASLVYHAREALVFLDVRGQDIAVFVGGPRFGERDLRLRQQIADRRAEFVREVGGKIRQATE